MEKKNASGTIMGICRVIRCLTVAPLMACVMLLILYGRDKALCGQAAGLAESLVFLVALPLLAYPLQPLVPRYRDSGREGQRSLAMIFAVAGYVLGCLVCLISGAPVSQWIIYLEYLLSGLLIFGCNKLLHRKASGHACGVAGPAALLIYFGVPAWIPALLVMAAVWWASLVMRRHTLGQLAGGTVIPVAVMAVIRLVAGPAAEI
ncbi:hypothetical protein [Eisenbergiella sp.]